MLQGLLFFFALFSLKLRWVVLVIIGLTFTGSNLLGYMRCRLGSTVLRTVAALLYQHVAVQVAGAAHQYLQQRVLANLTSVFKSTPPATQTSA